MNKREVHLFSGSEDKKRNSVKHHFKNIRIEALRFFIVTVTLCRVSGEMSVEKVFVTCMSKRFKRNLRALLSRGGCILATLINTSAV